jgi:hypothetical protein
MITPEDARAAIAAKIAQSVRPKPFARPGQKSAAAAQASATTPPAGDASALPSPAPALTAPESKPASLETSILAAIAEAVDVLVEDGEPGTEKAAAVPALPVGRKRSSTPAVTRPAVETRAGRAEPQPRSTRARPEAGDDIGDEIQRIIATYHRNRKDEPSA